MCLQFDCFKWLHHSTQDFFLIKLILVCLSLSRCEKFHSLKNDSLKWWQMTISHLNCIPFPDSASRALHLLIGQGMRSTFNYSPDQRVRKSFTRQAKVQMQHDVSSFISIIKCVALYVCLSSRMAPTSESHLWLIMRSPVFASGLFHYSSCPIRPLTCHT